MCYIMGNVILKKLICGDLTTDPPPTIQIQTDIDYNSDQFNKFEFITFNYKGDVQYYNTDSLRSLTSGILPVIVYPSIPPYSSTNQWPLFCFTPNGTGTQPSDLNPNKPYNGNKIPEGWTSFSHLINSGLSTFNYNKYGLGCLLPQSNYLQNSIKHHENKTVSLFCAFYHTQIPSSYKLKLPITDDLTFYLLDVQNGD